MGRGTTRGLAPTPDRSVRSYDGTGLPLRRHWLERFCSSVTACTRSSWTRCETARANDLWLQESEACGPPTDGSRTSARFTAPPTRAGTLAGAASGPRRYTGAPVEPQIFRPTSFVLDFARQQLKGTSKSPVASHCLS